MVCGHGLGKAFLAKTAGRVRQVPLKMTEYFKLTETLSLRNKLF